MSTQVRDTRNENWMWARRELIREHGDKLGPYGIAVYMAIASCADVKAQTARPSYKYIADMIGASRRKVIDAAKTLRELGWIEVRERNDEKTQKSNTYVLLPAPIEGSAQDAPRSERDAPPNEKSPNAAREGGERRAPGSERDARTPVHEMHEGSAQDAPKQERKEQESRERERESARSGADAREEKISSSGVPDFDFLPTRDRNEHLADVRDTWRAAVANSSDTEPAREAILAACYGGLDLNPTRNRTLQRQIDEHGVQRSLAAHAIVAKTDRVGADWLLEQWEHDDNDGTTGWDGEDYMRDFTAEAAEALENGEEIPDFYHEI